MCGPPALPTWPFCNRLLAADTFAKTGTRTFATAYWPPTLLACPKTTNRNHNIKTNILKNCCVLCLTLYWHTRTSKMFPYTLWHARASNMLPFTHYCKHLLFAARACAREPPQGSRELRGANNTTLIKDLKERPQRLLGKVFCVAICVNLPSTNLFVF